MQTKITTDAAATKYQYFCRKLGVTGGVGVGGTGLAGTIIGVINSLFQSPI